MENPDNDYVIDNYQPFFTNIWSFRGRIKRTHFWLYLLTYVGITFSLLLLLIILGAVFRAPAFSLLMIPVWGVMAYLQFCVVGKRYHDMGQSVAIPLTLVILNVVILIATIALTAMQAAWVSSHWYSYGSSPYTGPIQVLSILAIVVAIASLVCNLIIPGCVPSKPGINKYGTNPCLPADQQE